MVKQSIMHLYIYGLLKREIKGGNIIHINKIHPIIKWYIRLPRKYHYMILNEMIEVGLVKRLGRDNFELVGCEKLKEAPIDSLGNPLW